jgi:hypothetical protein
MQLEEKVATLDKDCWDMVQEQSMLKNKSKALKKELEILQRELSTIRAEGKRLQDLNLRQQMEKMDLHKQVKNLEYLKGRLDKKLGEALKDADLIIKLNKEELMRKNLEDLYRGEPKGFKTLFNAMQLFMDEIIMVEEGLQREVKEAREYLQSKVQRTADEKPEGRKKPHVVLDVTSSGSEKAGPVVGTSQRQEGDEALSSNQAFETLQEEKALQAEGNKIVNGLHAPGGNLDREDR